MEICDFCGNRCNFKVFAVREINLENPHLEFRSRYMCEDCIKYLEVKNESMREG